MALGTNYKRIMDNEDKRRVRNLDNHFDLMQGFIAEGMGKDEASKKAFRIVTRNKG
jgi:hypothetical protein